MPFAARAKKVSTIHALKYTEPHNRKNAWYLLLVLLEVILLLGLTSVVNNIVQSILSVNFISKVVEMLSQKIGAGVEFVTSVLFAVLLNLVVIYLYAVLKALLKKAILDPAFGFTKLDKKERRAEKRKNRKEKKNKKNKKSEQESDEPEPTPSSEERRIPLRTTTEEKREGVEKEEIKELGKTIHKGFWGIFFEGENLEYAKPWVVRVDKVLQGFIYFVQILYALLFLFLLYTVFFPCI